MSPRGNLRDRYNYPLRGKSMAEVTPDTVTTQTVLSGGEPGKLAGLKHMVISLVDNPPSDADTYTLSGQYIVRAAWEPSAFGQECGAFQVASTGSVLFSTDVGATPTGYLHIWL